MVVDRDLANPRHHVPSLDRVGGIVEGRLDHNHTLHAGIEVKKTPQGRIFRGLVSVGTHGSSAVGAARSDPLQHEVDLLVRDDVADVLRTTEEAVSQSNDLVAHHSGAAAVAVIDRGIDLHSKAEVGSAVGGKIDPRNDSLCDGEAFAPGRIAVDQNGVPDAGETNRPHERWMGREKRLVVQLQHREVDSLRHGFHLRRDAVARLATLYLEIGDILDQVGIGQDPVALDDETRPADLQGV